ncbi:MAG: hypothetical protein V2J62_06235 [candidate division KSB1 bacterium]|jgi:hypothetical protein|nr:hypothetical protein [candidate division KSB1 bacterium]
MRNLSGSILAMVLFLFIASCSNHTMTKNQWADPSVSTDGVDSEWESASLTIPKDIDIAIGTQNDSENLYVMCRFTDQILAHRIGMMGITLWFDQSGKKNKEYGVRYRGSSELINNLQKMVEREGDRPERISEMSRPMGGRQPQKNDHMPDPGNIVYIQQGKEIELNEQQVDGPGAASSFSDGVYVYEFRLPFPATGQMKDNVKLGVELGGIDMAQRQERRGGMRGGPGGRQGGGMRGGMGRPGGDMRGGDSQRPDMENMQKKEIWLNVEMVTSDIK